jgi:hypothetical protein
MIALIERAGFKNADECFGKVRTLGIPKISRGDELIWSAKGDPEPEQTEEEKAVAKRFNSLTTLILRKFAELYPSYTRVRL